MATPTVKAAPPRADRRLELSQLLADLVIDGRTALLDAAAVLPDRLVR